MMFDLIEKMHPTLHPEVGCDDIIVVTTSAAQAKKWEERLQRHRGLVTRPDANIIVLWEDWPGGAGNGLGTLFAFQQAEKRIPQLQDALTAGKRIALYHTAGKGTRLAPLTLSEECDKSAVKLPVLLPDGEYLTLLEATIRQTAPFVQPGRLSVFWGDQLFVPKKPLPLPPSAHVQIFAKCQPLPSKQRWEKEGLSNYGLLAMGKQETALLEKMEYDWLEVLLQRGAVDAAKGVGMSLGSFSLSPPLLSLLLEEFAPELSKREGKWDSDPHFWMPMTLDLGTYRDALSSAEEERFLRMQGVREKLLSSHPLPLLQSRDVGNDGYWWDFGSVRNYYENVLLLTKKGEETEAFKCFLFGREIPDPPLISSEIRENRSKNSVLVGVKADVVDVEEAVLIATRAKRVSGRKILCYQVKEEEISAEGGEVIAGVSLPGNPLPFSLHTNLERDGKRDWKTSLPRNSHSYEEIHLAWLRQPSP